MSELQNDDAIVDNENIEDVSEAEVEEVGQETDESSDLAPDSEQEHEQNPEEPEDSSKVNQDAINKVINRKHYEAQEAKRRADELEQRLRQYESQQSSEPSVPPKPDPFEDNYDAKMGEYEKAIEKRAQWRYEQQYAQQQNERQQQQQQMEQQRKLQESATKYMEAAKANGITQEEVVQAGQVVESYGLNTDLQMYLLGDPDGALIVKHLAANPSEVASLSSMSPYQAGAYIDGKLRNAARQLKPKSTNTPPPAKRASSGNVDPELGKYKHIGGAKFE